MTYQEWKTNELAGEGGFTFAEEELTLSAYNAGLEHNEQNVCGECGRLVMTRRCHEDEK